MLTFQLCCPGNLVQVECQLCYQAILLIVKMTQLLNCFWCSRIVHESKYLEESHCFGLPWAWDSWYWHVAYGALGNYSCLQERWAPMGLEASKPRRMLYLLMCVLSLCTWAAMWRDRDEPLHSTWAPGRTPAEEGCRKLPCWPVAFWADSHGWCPAVVLGGRMPYWTNRGPWWMLE